MPLVHRTNNRIQPANVRSAAVARDSVARLVDAQRHRYAAAFQVQGTPAVLYHRLNHGETCLCQGRNQFAGDRLSAEGKASTGAINSILTQAEFNVRRYGSNPSLPPTSHPDVLEVDLNGVHPSSVDLTSVRQPSIFETDSPSNFSHSIGTNLDRYATDPLQAGSGTIVPDGVGPNGPVGLSPELEDLMGATTLDLGILGGQDLSCPICFGSGFVGGFSILNGFRRVLVPNSASDLVGGMVLSEGSPYAELTQVSWTVVLPVLDPSSAPPFALDALKVWGTGPEIIQSPPLTIDSMPIIHESQFLAFCDGRPHVLRLDFGNTVTKVSHVEVQVNLGSEWAYFDLPKVTKSTAPNLSPDSLDPFSIVVSPLVPALSPLDVLYDSTYNRHLQVKTVPTWATSDRSVLGWEAEVRPVQPHELLRLLPGRRRVQSASSRPVVFSNSSRHSIIS